MNAEIRRMLSGKGFLAAVLLGCFGIILGASYPRLEELLPAGSFLRLEREAFSSQAVGFLLPVMAVLPWSDSFLVEWKSGFLKSGLPRTGRRAYVESKIFTVAMGSFLAWMAAGAAVLFFFFVVFLPFEKKEVFQTEEILKLLFSMMRGGLIAAILGSLGGLCGALTGSAYMAYGLPFVGYYFCMILYERYFQEALWLYPKEWLAGNSAWGENNQGLWLFLLLFLAAVMAAHGGVLYGRLEEL